MMSSIPTLSARAGLAVTVLCAVLAACSNDSLSSGGGGPDAQRLRDSLVVSGPLTSSFAVARPRVSAARTASPSVGAQLVYLSLPPGSLDGGDSVRVVSEGIVSTEPMFQGGFDPIPVFANTLDSLPVTVFMAGEEVGPVYVRVPPARPPTVIRTAPPKGHRDIPLNQLIVIVFSQPIDPSTVTQSSVKLSVVGGETIPAVLSVVPTQPWVVRIAPETFLSPNTTYSIQVDATVKDAGGFALAAPLSSDFTTGISADSVASVAVFANGGGFGRRPSSVAVATPGGKVQFLAYEVSLSGDTLTPGTSAPITWSTSDPSVATIDADGLLSAVASGGANVAACTGSICGNGSIIVDVLPTGITPLPLGDLGGGYSRLFAFEGGYATGYSTIAGGQCKHAFLWSALRGMEDLGAPSGDCNSYGWLVNSSGVVIGSGAGGNIIWKRATGWVVLTDPDAGHGGWYPAKINNNGDIAWASGDGTAVALQTAANGIKISATPAESTFIGGLTDQGVVTLSSPVAPTMVWVMDAKTGIILSSLQDFDPVTSQPLKIYGYDINEHGMILGVVNWDVDPKYFRWKPILGFEYLPSPGPGITPEPFYINNSGDVNLYLVSYRHIGTDSLFEGRSAVWMGNGSLVMLGGLGGTHTFVNGINDNHEAAGHSQVGSNTGPQEAVLWRLPSGAVASANRSSASAVPAQPQRPSRAARISSHDVSPQKRPRTRQPAIQ